MFDKKTIAKIRVASIEMEKAGKLAHFVLELIYKEKLFKLFIPKKDGGRMLSLPEALRKFDEAARIDGNLGWAITIGSGGGYFYGYMQPEVASKVFSPAKAVVAGSGHPSAIADEAKGGYNVTGQWKYASGAPYASVFTANAMIKGKKKDAPKIRAFAFKPNQVTIIKDWNAFGMKATESHSFKVNKAFVPNEMTFDLSTTKLFYEAPIYRYPFLQFAETSFASMVIGLGRHFMEEAHAIIKQNKEVWSSAGRYKTVSNKMDKAGKEFYKASKSFYSTVDASWLHLVKKGKLDAKTQKSISKVSQQTSRIVLACADELMQFLGMQAVMQDSNINRVWRDLHTACQHVLLIPFEE